jgi:hypothetical protein
LANKKLEKKQQQAKLVFTLHFLRIDRAPEFNKFLCIKNVLANYFEMQV